MKRKLLLAVLCVVGALGMRAQTDVTSQYLTNADFSGTYTPAYTINTDRYVYQPDGWTVDYRNVSTWNMTVVGSTDKMASNFTGTYAVPADNNRYMVRFRDNQTSEYIDLSQTITIKVTGTYNISAYLIREDGSKATVKLYAGNTTVENSNPGAWETKSLTVNLKAGDEIKVGVRFENKGADGKKAGADNVKIEYIENKTLTNLVAKANEYFPSLAAGDLKDAIDEATATKNNFENTDAYQTRVENAISGLRAAVKAQTAVDANMTLAIVNPSFEDDNASTNAPSGWNITNKGSDYGARAVGESNYSMSNADGDYLFNNWQSWWMTCSVEQEISSMPNGQYELSAVVAGYDKSTTTLTANGAFQHQVTTGAANGIAVSVTAYVEDGTLTIGANSVGTSGKTFLKVDNFTLTYKGIKPLLAKIIDEAPTDVNVGSDVFQIPSTAYNELASVVQAATEVYNKNDATMEEVQTAIDDLNAAIATYNNVTLNAPDNNKRYTLTIVESGKAWNGNAITFIAGGRPDMGLYGIKYLTPANANMNQALKFTAVEGETNTYKVSAINVETGGEQYITTGSTYSGGNNSQIRTTDDATEASKIKIQATTTNGQFQLLNVSDGNKVIANNNNDDMYTNGDASFTIAEATQAEVAVSVAAGKYATRIFPFKPTLPEGVVAYSCEVVSGETLTLEEVTSPAANVPYILYSENGVETTNLTGWGTAVTDSYTDGLLTGVYTNAAVTAGKYVLQTQGGVQGFYEVDGDDFTAIPYRAYLTLPSTSTEANVRALFFPAAGEATGIEAIGVLTSGNYDAIYTAGGAKVNSLQKGLNIVVKDGKSHKIYVK